MPRRRVVALCVALCVGTLGVCLAQPDAPPSVRSDRSRTRLAARGGWAVAAKLYSPNDAARAALDDARALVAVRFPALFAAGPRTPEQAEKLRRDYLEAYAKEFRHVRYLTSYNFPEAMRADVYRDVAFLVNSLSRSDEIVRPAGGGPGGILVRVNLRDYDIDPRDWDRLGLTEPYFHQDLVEQRVVPRTRKRTRTVDHKGGDYTYPDGRVARDVAPGRYDVEFEEKVDDRGEPVTVRALAAWIDPAVNTELAFLLQAKAPLLRADWWIANASVPPGYYDLLRLKTLDDFRELGAFDERAERRKEIKATVVRSGSRGLATPVARNNRILARTPTFQGYFWETFDFNNSVKARNVINNFLNIKENEAHRFEVGELSGLRPREWLQHVRKGKTEFRDAGEWIASLPNGLQAYFLSDGNDKRLDEAAIAVAFDSTSHDFRVISARSCIWCHTDGIRPFKSHFQLQVGTRQLTDLGIFLRDTDKALELSDFIRRTFGSPDFDEVLVKDREFYAAAVKKANGLDPERNASVFRTHWDGHQEVDLDGDRICYELGLQPREVEALITLRKDGVNSGVLLQRLLKPPIAIRRDQWEEVFADAAVLTTLLRK